MERALLDVAVAAAQAGGEVILNAHQNRKSGHLTPSSTKGPNDYVTEIDKRSEARIISIIRDVYPNHDIQAEESPQEPSRSDYRWIIDPLDGTTNFIHGFPTFAVSVGVSYKNRMQVGVVFDPVHGEMFRAKAGEGAFLNDERIQVSEVRRLEDGLILTGFPFKSRQYLHKYLAIFEELFRSSSGIRRAGAAALDLAYVACGRADGFFELFLSPWDMAAGAVLVLEAGGLVTDFTGGEEYMSTGHIVAGHEAIVEQILPRIARQFPIF